MWGRKTKLFVTFGTLIILCGLLVQSKRGLPKKPMKAITNSHRAARTQKLKNRRNHIIKCCGKKSCLPTNPKLRPKHLENRTTVSTTVLEVKETSQAPNPKQTTVDLPGSSIQATEQTTNPNDANKLMETTAHLDPTADPSSTSGDVVTEKSTSSLSSLESETTLAADRPTEQQSAKTTDNYQQIATTQDVAKLTTSFKTSNPTTSSTTTTTTFRPLTKERLYTCSSTQCTRNNTLARSDPAFVYRSTWYSACGNSFIFGTQLVSWEENFKMCCSVGMIPISIESETKLSCLASLMNSNWPFSIYYWTSGRKLFHPNSTFEFCLSSGNIVTNTTTQIWAPGEPVGMWDRLCVLLALDKKTNSALLYARNCSEKSIFACQGPMTTTPAPNPRYSNCKKVSKCTKNETLFSELLNKGVQLTNYENTNISDDFMNATMASVGMDECDTASLVFSCVQDESPDIVQRAILNVETSNAVEFAALPSAQALCRDSSSVAFLFRAECRKAYVDEDPKPCGKRAFYNVCGGRNYVITDSNTTNGIGPATGACMDWGLKLASFETYEEFMCVAELFALTNATVYAWTSGSFWILSDKPVWCGSNTPLKTSKYPWNLDGRKTLVGIPLERSCSTCFGYYLAAAQFIRFCPVWGLS
ncbi:Hypothetical predicted protein [Cloeon dipterum]|uniref:C-type lectin domain-containing protein n=1 Tax=Cloeon dipterum TaxID=197152 RepID=A0A8S1BY04_9INSE|nr:Hypothetical predicted protein [Cloeon dipterum]